MAIGTTTGTPPIDAATAQRALVRALQDPARYPHPASAVALLETHISYVLLTGRFAYKIKKAVNLGFLDFSSLAQRRFYCAEELRLNRRLAPELYLDVVAIGGTPAAPLIGAEEGGECIEYAVRMHEFPQGALFDRRLAQGELSPADIDGVADRLAAFHAQAARAATADGYGSATAVWAPLAGSFGTLRSGLHDAASLALLTTLETWSRDEHARLVDSIASRLREGFVRECHGDLHLGNIALWHGVPQIFDCIEFNPQLRWIDVISDVAFLSMDLEEKGRADYASRFLNAYLESTGDYAGLRLLPFYRTYRALVRAKIALIRAAQENPPSAAAPAVCAQYLAFARRASLPRRRQLLLMHGVSGSGKTRLSQVVLEHVGGLRIRSDIERKRLGALPPLARSGAVGESGLECGLYSAETTHATYRQLAFLARLIFDAGFSVVVDAASLQRWQRESFRALAAALNVPFRILSCRADDAVLRQRLVARQRAGSDASDAGVAVLEQQLQSQEALSGGEARQSVSFDSGRAAPDDVLQWIDQEETP